MACPVCQSAPGCECVVATPDGVALAGTGLAASPLIVPTTVVAAGSGVTVASATSGLGGKKTTYTVTVPAFDSSGAPAATISGLTGASSAGAYTGFSAPTPNRIAGQLTFTANASAAANTDLVRVSFGTAYGTVPRAVLLGNLVNGQPGFYVSALTSSFFDLRNVNALTNGTAYRLSYVVVV